MHTLADLEKQADQLEDAAGQAKLGWSNRHRSVRMFDGITECLVLFVLLLVGLEVGRWLRQRRARLESEDSAGTAAAEGVVFAVLGLLIAFTFSAAAARFDERRMLINEQANALGTAWLRLDLLPEADRQAIQRDMRSWVELTLDAVKHDPTADMAAFRAKLQEAADLQNRAWRGAVESVKGLNQPPLAAFVLSPLNDWIDLTSTRLSVERRSQPPLVRATLVVLSLVGAVLAGYAAGRRQQRSLLHMLSFAAVIAFAMYVITDLNHPRSGFIRVDAADDAMRQLLASMQPN